MKKQRVNSTNSDDTPRSAPIPPRLSSRLEGRLASYALAAGAAGVGVLALAPPAKADIIYTSVSISVTYPGYLLDINNDGAADFSFQQVYPYPSGGNIKFRVAGLGDNAVLLSPLARGYPVGPGENFVQGGTLLTWRIIEGIYAGHYHHYTFGEGWSGPWSGHALAALGLRFMIGSEAHYGYVRLNIQPNPPEAFCVGRYNCNLVPPNLVLDDYAYETVANKSILTTVPEPATLGLLALGSLGIAAWRRRKTVTSVN